MFAVKKCFNYVFSQKYTLLADHKPMTAILEAEAAVPSAQHYFYIIQCFLADAIVHLDTTTLTITLIPIFPF